MTKQNRMNLENWLAIAGVVVGVASTAITVYVNRRRMIVLSDAQLLALVLLLDEPPSAAVVAVPKRKSRAEEFDEMRKPGGRS